MSSKKIIFFLCMYKMYLILPEGYKNAEVDTKIVRKTGEIWVSMKDDGSGMVVKNISDLVLKELVVYLKQKSLQKSRLANTK